LALDASERFFRREAGLAQGGDGERVVALGEAFPLFVEHERVVEIDGLRKS